MAEPKWAPRGECMESCNCDYLCPCIYTNPQGPATYAHCTAVMVFRIEEGSFGETKLAGLKFALVIRSGWVMADVIQAAAFFNWANRLMLSLGEPAAAVGA
jgi:hypothetical protein